MNEDVGPFIAMAEDGECEGLSLRFIPGSLPLKQRWRNNGLSADFLADYVQTFFPASDSDPAARRRQLTIKGAVNFIANELLENAMKYSEKQTTRAIAMNLFLGPQRILFHQTNSAGLPQIAKLRAFLARLETVGAEAMFMEQLEKGEKARGWGY